MRTILIFILLTSIAQAQFITNLQFTKDAKDITLTWEVNITGASIGIFRAKQFVELLPGDATTWQITEPDYGIYTYTVVWVWSWQSYQFYYEWLQVSVNVGTLMWDHPATIPDGYLIYLSQIEDEFGPDATLKISQVSELTLFNLLPHIVQGETYYIAVASYEEPTQGELWISPLGYKDNAGNSLLFQYIDKSWDGPQVKKGSNLRMGD